MAPKAKKSEMIKVMQFGSAIRRDKRQSEYLKSLGLGKINKVRELQDSPSVQALLKRLEHMVRVID